MTDQLRDDVDEPSVSNEAMYVTVAIDPDDPQQVPFVCSAWHEFQVEENPAGYEAHLECLHAEWGAANVKTAVIEIEPDWMLSLFDAKRFKGKKVATIEVEGA